MTYLAILSSVGPVYPAQPRRHPQGVEPALPVLDPHGAGEDPGTPGLRPQHGESSQGSSRSKQILSGQELCWSSHHLGQDVWNI